MTTPDSTPRCFSPFTPLASAPVKRVELALDAPASSARLRTAGAAGKLKNMFEG
ncbi:hypothetical protein THAOC_24725, partial [Thalassiosira oceanica]